jgi:hypothetical protein
MAARPTCAAGLVLHAAVPWGQLHRSFAVWLPAVSSAEVRAFLWHTWPEALQGRRHNYSYCLCGLGGLLEVALSLLQWTLNKARMPDLSLSWNMLMADCCASCTCQA